MTTVEEARRLVMAHVRHTTAERIPLARAAGRYLAEEVRAPHDHPLFDNCAVDGYAFAFGDPAAPSGLRLVAELAAGGTIERPLGRGECARVFTGAMLPEGADTVVMQEFTAREGDTVRHGDTKLRVGGNVRRKGEQYHAGDRVMEAGTRLTPEAIGALASVGVREVAAHLPPRVAVVVTGGEFNTGASPVPGRIFGSNDVMLAAAFAEAGAPAVPLYAEDDRDTLARTLGEALDGYDIVVTTGGVSVGDHDLVRPVLEDLGVDILFHKVSQKPGKPMLFGVRGGTRVLGLPGNPRAVMVLFWEYVLPHLRATMGSSAPSLRSERLPLSGAVGLKGERAEFRAVRVRAGRVELLRDEGSHMLRSLMDADALACFPADASELRKGDLVEIHHLPGR